MLRAQAALTRARSQAPSGSRRIRPAFSARRTAVSLTPSCRASSRLLVVRIHTTARKSSPKPLIPIVFSACYSAGERSVHGLIEVADAEHEDEPEAAEARSPSRRRRRSPPSSPRRPRSTRRLLGSRRSATIISTTAPTRSPGAMSAPCSTTPSCSSASPTWPSTKASTPRKRPDLPPTPRAASRRRGSGS